MKVGIRVLQISCVTILLSAGRSWCQPTLFDSSFGVGSGADGAVNALVVQTNGKVFVGGEFTSVSGQSNAYLSRLNADGSPDPTFYVGSGTDGYVNRMLV